MFAHLLSVWAFLLSVPGLVGSESDALILWKGLMVVKSPVVVVLSESVVPGFQRRFSGNSVRMSK